MPNGRTRTRWLLRSLVLSVLTISHASEAFLMRPDTPLGLRPARHSTTLHMGAKSGGKIVTSKEEFAEATLSATVPRPVMVFFTAPWCGPCRLSIPVVKEVIKEYSGQIEGLEVCTDDFPDIAADAGVVSIPTIQIYYKGEVKDTIVGCVARKVLSMAVGKVLEDSGQDVTNGESGSSAE